MLQIIINFPIFTISNFLENEAYKRGLLRKEKQIATYKQDCFILSRFLFPRMESYFFSLLAALNRNLRHIISYLFHCNNPNAPRITSFSSMR